MSVIVKDRDDAIWLLKNEFQKDIDNMADEQVDDEISGILGIDFNVQEKDDKR